MGSRPTAVAPGSGCIFRWRWPCASVWGAYSPGVWQSVNFLKMGNKLRQLRKETMRSLARCHAGLLFLPVSYSYFLSGDGKKIMGLGGGLGPSHRVGSLGSHRASVVVDGPHPLSGWESGYTSCRDRWRPNGCIRPVLKQGPRSATSFGGKSKGRSESGVRQLAACCGGSPPPPPSPLPTILKGVGRIIDRCQATLQRDLSERAPVVTRKTVNYA